MYPNNSINLLAKFPYTTASPHLKIIIRISFCIYDDNLNISLSELERYENFFCEKKVEFYDKKIFVSKKDYDHFVRWI